MSTNTNNGDRRNKAPSNTGGRGRGRGRGGGRGGGRGRPNINSRNTNDNARPSFSSSSVPRAKQPTPPPSTSTTTTTTRTTMTGSRSADSSPSLVLRRNGEKGAESHTVSEKERIHFTRLLMDFRENDHAATSATGGNSGDAEQVLELPSTLTNTERKFIHELARQLGLKSKSTGKDDNRRITVSKRGGAGAGKQMDDETTEKLPVLKLGRQGIEALRRHVTKFPPTRTEEQESHRTGASLVEAIVLSNSNSTDPNNALTEMMQRMDHRNAPVAAPRTVKVDLNRRIRNHAAAQERKQSHPQYTAMQAVRRKLPAFALQDVIVETVRRNQVTIVSGETGSGKTTQVPQFILDANPGASIVVTQPRRISAMSVAERVAQEQCLEIGQDMIGYQVRLESCVSRSHSQLLFLTPGVLLRQLQSSRHLNEYTHIVIDEIHERDKYTEFLLVALRDLLFQRTDLRIVLMSATLQIEALVEYWQEGFLQKPALVELEGRTFPVQDFFLEQALAMTGFMGEYVDDDVAASNNNDNNSNNGQVRMDALEAELAALTAPVSCAMCGTSFADPIELGEHVALCDGGGDVSMDELYARLHQTVNNGAAVVAPDALDEVDEASKWDGVSPFEPSDDCTDTTTGREEKLLEQYQTTRDDEQVDCDLLLHIVHYIVKSSRGDGAILVFFSGWQEISEFSLLLENTSPFHDRSKYWILPLHSGIPSRDQRKVFQVPPRGVRKIILSTNLAETSVTVSDVSFVVDTGRVKEKSYDPHLKTSTLQPTWISQASAKQRRGRAGRTKAGVCFRLFSRRRFLSMKPFVESELLRTPLEEMCLLCKKLDLAPGGPEDADGVPAFLSKAMTPPHTKSITNALELLVDLGAMEPVTNNLTSLGQCLSVLSLEPRVGKMVLWGYLLGCARVASSMGVAMSYKSPFVMPPPSMQRSADSAMVQLSRGTESDQVTVLYALQKRDQLTNNRSGVDSYNNFCRQHFLGTSTMQMISDLRLSLTRELSTLGFPNPTGEKQYHNRHENDHALWQAAIAAGLYPNIASRRRDDVNFSTMTNQKAKIHRSSVNSVRGQPLNGKCQVPVGEVEFVAFGELVKGKNFFTMNQTTHLASALPFFLLCGTSLSITPMPDDTNTAVLDVDGWIVFKCNSETASHIVILRKRLEGAFWRFITHPASGLTSLTNTERDAVEILGAVLQSAHRSVPGR